MKGGSLTSNQAITKSRIEMFCSNHRYKRQTPVTNERDQGFFRYTFDYQLCGYSVGVYLL